MARQLPGTALRCPPEKETDAFSVLEPIFAVSGGGLLLSQVCEMTGLSPSTIQNWVKRGWVANPVNKKYDEIKVARILLLNLLRHALPLERIVRLLTYVNGRVDDRADDSMPDTRLYSLICRAIFRLEDGGRLDGAELQALIREQLAGAPRTVADAEERLQSALEVLLLSIEAAQRMEEAQARYAALEKEGRI